MACVTNVWYSTRFNNVPLEPFTPSRGLRQGDPLSPYLFIFVADGFFKLIQRECGNKGCRNFISVDGCQGSHISYLWMIHLCSLKHRRTKQELSMGLLHLSKRELGKSLTWPSAPWCSVPSARIRKGRMCLRSCMFQTGSGRKIPGAAHPGEENDERKVQNGERETSQQMQHLG
jgi:hypothetical protein